MMRSTWVSNDRYLRALRAERRKKVAVLAALVVSSWVACLAIVFAAAGIIWLVSTVLHSNP